MGATDSAVPCAFMLDLAEALDPLLNEREERLEDGEEDDEDVAETTLQLVFFDGEEAFKDWTATDSIYGARYGGITESKYESCSFFFFYFISFRQASGKEMGNRVYTSAYQTTSYSRILRHRNLNHRTPHTSRSSRCP